MKTCRICGGHHAVRFQACRAIVRWSHTNRAAYVPLRYPARLTPRMGKFSRALRELTREQTER